MGLCLARPYILAQIFMQYHLVGHLKYMITDLKYSLRAIAPTLGYHRLPQM